MIPREELLLPAEGYSAIHRLYQRYKVKPAGYGGLVFLSRIIQPVTIVDDVVATPTLAQGDTATIAIGSGAVITVLNVPDGKRWKVFSFDATRLTGDNTIEGIILNDASASLQHTIASITPASSYVSGIYGHPFPLDQKDSIRLDMAAAGTATSTFRGTALVLEEDAYS